MLDLATPQKSRIAKALFQLSLLQNPRLDSIPVKAFTPWSTSHQIQESLNRGAQRAHLGYNNFFASSDDELIRAPLMYRPSSHSSVVLASSTCSMCLWWHRWGVPHSVPYLQRCYGSGGQQDCHRPLVEHATLLARRRLGSLIFIILVDREHSGPLSVKAKQPDGGMMKAWVRWLLGENQFWKAHWLFFPRVGWVNLEDQPCTQGIDERTMRP